MESPLNRQRATDTEISILLFSRDEVFAETLCNRFSAWGWLTFLGTDHLGVMDYLARQRVEVVMIDIRKQGDQWQRLMATILGRRGHPEIILLNHADNIRMGIAGMQAGATDEITEPFCAATLREKIIAARARRRERLKKEGRGIWGTLADAMAAAAFAQAGEFETAIEISRGGSDPPAPGDPEKRK